MTQTAADQKTTDSSSPSPPPQSATPATTSQQSPKQQQTTINHQNTYKSDNTTSSSCCAVVLGQQDNPKALPISDQLLLENSENRVKVYYESKELGQHELRLKYTDDEPMVLDGPVVFFVDIFGSNIKKIVSHEQQVVIDEVSNEVESTKFNVSLSSSFENEDDHVELDETGKMQPTRTNRYGSGPRFGTNRNQRTTTKSLTRTIEELFEEDSLEEVETVKYLTMPTATSAAQQNSKTTDNDQQQFCAPQKFLPLRYHQSTVSSSDRNNSEEREQENERGGKNDKFEDDVATRLRIVEHVKKNRTLFESQKHIYEPRTLTQASSRTASDNRSIQPDQTQQSHSPYKDLSRHTQQTTIYDRPTVQPRTTVASSSRRSAILSSLQDKPKLPKSKEKQSAQKSLSSFNNLLKKPIEFARKARDSYNNNHNQDTSRTKSKKQPTVLNQEQIRDQLSDKDIYKSPVKQYFSSSKRLYLLPARDFSVHLATRSIQEIVKFAEQQSKRDKESKSLTFKKKKIHQLFNTYSLRRTRQRQPKEQGDNFNRLSRCRYNSFNLGQSELQAPKKNEASANFEQINENLKAKIKMPSGKTDKASIVDNKDGTIKISYEPKEIGLHELVLRYNDEKIDDGSTVFYVDAVGGAKKKITAYGPGLTHGIAGDSSQFTINTGGLGSSKLNVTVEGPSKTQVNLTDNKDGTITVSYAPSLPGEYKIKISFDGKPIVGSPFVTNIRDEGRTRAHFELKQGNERSLNLKVSEDDLKCLHGIITSPCGLEEPCGLKLLANGQLAIVFTPRELGDHVVNVKRSGNHIAGSPFKFDILSRDIGDARQVKVSGKGIKEGAVNVKNEIVINTKEAGYGHLSISVEGPGRVELESEDGPEGIVKAYYCPTEPGYYSAIIRYADHTVPGSPFNITVTGKATNTQKEAIRKYRKAAKAADVNSECHFNFRMPGVSAYDISAKIHSPQANSEDVSVIDKGDYEYQVSFVPKEAGLYALSIKNKDIHILGSPFPYTVGPFASLGPHRVRCAGNGLIRGVCKKVNEFDVFNREAGSGELLVIVEGPSKPKLTFTDRKDCSCHIGYTVDEPGEYKIHVLFNDTEVPDSPFRAYVMPQTGDVAKIELGPLPPESMINLNKPCNMTVIMNGAKGNIEGKVRLPNGKFDDCFASPIDAENWGVRFIPRQLGVHQVHIKFNKGSAHIPQSPVFIRVGHDNADPAAVVAQGHGLKETIVNHVSDFTVDTCAAGHALLETTIEGPSRCPMNCVEVDDGYRFHYTPLAPGDYIITIKYDGCFINGSPFKITAIKQPGSKTVADFGAHELSSISISTTDRETKQKVEHMPKFKSDASRVYCKGMGLKKAFANKPNTITVNCSEAGFNMIYASFLGPTRNTIHDTSCKHMGGSIYQITYTCKDKGDAILLVKYGDELIPGSPFRLEVS